MGTHPAKELQRAVPGRVSGDLSHSCEQTPVSARSSRCIGQGVVANQANQVSATTVPASTLSEPPLLEQTTAKKPGPLAPGAVTTRCDSLAESSHQLNECHAAGGVLDSSVVHAVAVLLRSTGCPVAMGCESYLYVCLAGLVYSFRLQYGNMLSPELGT